MICPLINTRAQVETLVRTCRYPPLGFRSFGPVRASIYGGEDYGARANDELLVMPMIETVEALENIEEILATPGVDAAYVGPADLSLAMGKEPGLDRTDPEVVEAQKTIAAACRRHGVVAGIHVATPEYGQKMIEAGYRFVTLGSDSRMLAVQAAADVAAVRKPAAAGVVPTY